MRLTLSATLALLITLTACGSDDPAGPSETSEFTVKASGSATALAATGSALLAQAGVDPSSFSVGFLEMRLSSTTDCSGPYQTVFSRSTPNRLDLMTNPELASTDAVPAGTYPCVLMRISDLMRFVPNTTEGVCLAGVEVTRDIYRAEDSDSPYLDPDGTGIPARGTIASPVEDYVWAYLSTNPAAVEARGFSEYQVIPLASALVSPGTSTFYWDLSGAIGPEGSSCGTVGGSIGFR